MTWTVAAIKGSGLGVAAPAPQEKAQSDSPTLIGFQSNMLHVARENAKPDSLTLIAFLLSVLPKQGWYCVFTLRDTNHYWFSSISEMADFIESLGDRTDIYFAVASFKEAGTKKTGRTQDNVSAVKCFRLDLDAGVKKLAKHGPEKVYLDQAQALQDIKAFTEKTGLKPTYIVSSGEGLHVYYVLSEEVAGAQWQPVAKAFHKFGTARGLKLDAAVTANHAGVLRPIGTRHPNSKTVEVLA